MKAVVLLLTLFLAVQRLQGQCSLGCLSCRKTSPITFECSVCDLHNNYALNDDMKCVESEIEDCEIPSADHTKSMCLRCKKGFVYDAEQEKCVEVSEFHTVDNCDFYLALNHCQECESGYFINDGLCSALGDSEITDCESYNSDQTECLACSPGKYVKNNQCEDITKVDNCSLYSEFICDECENGYLHEKNYYSSSEMTSSLAHQIILNQEMNQERVMPPLPSVCIEQNIPHCVTYVNFSFCGVCDNGYYLDAERNCSENPVNEIPHCMSYTDATTCAECEIEYFLTSNECSERQMVDNCYKYEVNSSVCLECTGLFYLNSTDNKCVERVFSKHIEYCEERSVGEDTCAKCKDRFLPTSDNLGCLFHIENCNTYRTGTNFATTQFRCQICDENYYPTNDESECHEQDILNCHNYRPNENKCVECNNGFFYEEGEKTCEPRTALNCLTVYATQDKCQTCIEGYYFSDPNCVEYTVEKCTTLNATSDSCDVCFDNHFKKDGRCFEYNIVGCIEFEPDANECVTCNSGFYKEGTSCAKLNLNNCLRASNTSNECLECEDNYYLDTSGGNICKKIYVPHCDDLSSTFNECNTGGCAEGFWLDTTDGNICKKISQDNCVTTNADGNCTECEEGFVQVDATVTNPCIRQYKPFCKTYTANSLNCSECEENYYMDGGSCYAQNAAGCKTFASSVNATNDDCTECIEGYYFDTANSKCYPYTITNCASADPNKDKCTECMDGFYIQNQGLTCVKSDIPNCAEAETPSAGTDTYVAECTTCVVGFGLTETKQCAPLFLDTHCLVPDNFETGVDSLIASAGTITKTDAPFFICKVCEHGYFPDDTSAGGCKEISHTSDANCVRTSFNLDECVECVNLKFPDSGTCAPITTAAPGDCYLSNGFEDKCLICNNAHFSDASGTCTDNTGASNTVDSKCIANGSTTTDTCTLCDEGYSLYTTTASTSFLFDNACTTMADPNCTYCEEGYAVQSNICTKFEGDDILCLRKKDSHTTNLNNDTECEKCANYDKYYLHTDDVCTPRTKPLIDGCAKLDDATDACSYCETGKGFFGAVKMYGMCQKENRNGANPRTSLAGGEIEHCLVYDAAQAAGGTKHCLVCKIGYKPASTPTTCESFDGINFSIDYTNGVFTDLAISTGITTGGTRPGISQAVAWHMDCDPGYLKIVLTGLTVSSTLTALNSHNLTDVYTNYHKSLKIDLPWANRSKLQECFELPGTPDDIITIKTIDPAAYGKIDTGLENCEIAVRGTETEIFCIQCKDGFLTRLVAVKDTADGTDNDLIFTAVSCLEKTNEFTRQFKNVEYPYPAVTSFIADEMLNFDSCADGRIFVAHMIQNTNKFWEWDTYVSGTDAHQFPNNPAYKCVNSINKTDFIPNCHIYAAKILSDVESSSTTVAKCMACKPGFKATHTTDSKDITACDPILNCDVSDPSKNTWMNLCETCSTGFAYKYNSTDGVFDLDSCEPIDQECLLLDASDNCIVCKKGYELTFDHKCVALNASANGCTNFGHGANFMHQKNMLATPFDITTWNPGAADSEHYTHNYALLNYIYNDGSDTANAFGCMDCPDYIPPISLNKTGDGSAPIFACFENPNSVRDDIAKKSKCANMKYFDNTVTTDATRLCSVPKEGYVYDETNNTFADNTTVGSNFGCTILNTAVCTTCIDGYVLNSSNACIPDLNCAKHNAGKDKCLECKQGFVKDFNDSTTMKCIEPIPGDPCDKWDYTLGCVRCKNGNTPITIKTNQGTFGPDSYENYYARCSSVTSTATYPKFPFMIEWVTDKWVASEKWANLPEDGMVTSTVLPQTSYCVPTLSIPHCKELAQNNVCLQCDDGYYFSDAFTCLPGTKANCIRYGQNELECVLCGAGYWANSGNCTARTNSKNCLKTKPHADECEECHYDQFITTSGLCQERSRKNCKVSIPSFDFCSECLQGYTFDSLSQCVPINNPGCETLYTGSDECWRCKEGFYPDADGKCVRYNNPGCMAFRPGTNQCVQCESEYFLEYNDSTNTSSRHDDILKCTLRQKTGCLVAASTVDKCFSCKPGMYLSGNACKLYTVRNCSLFNSSANECVDCLEGFFRDSNKNCVANADPNCRIMGKYNSRCLVCKDGSHFDSNSDLCKLNTKSCQTFNPNADECLTCEDGLWNHNGTCKRYTARNCLVFSTSSDRCATCIPQHYLNGTNGNCYPSSDPNCEIIENYSDSCIKCYPGYFINDSKKCQAYTINHCEYENLRKNACLYCKEGYYLDNDLDCKKNTQKNCLGYIGNMNKCATCQPNHYYNNGGCLAYTIENCRQFDFYADNCNICEEGHYKYMNTCKPYVVEHCKTFDPNMDHCTSCDDDRYLSLGQCHEYTIEDCEEYHPLANKCIKCEGKMHFRNGHGECQDVTEVEYCEEYHDTLDECVECEEGTYMEEKKCIKNPSGVPNCKSYFTETLCAACDSPYYLKENQCLRTSVVIPLCEHYNFDSNCGRCEGNAFLISNACQEPTNTTCTEWSSPENCSKCAANEVLNTAGSTVICEASGIDFCLEAEYSTEPITTTTTTDTGDGGDSTDTTTDTSTTPAVTNLCRKCQPGYYLNNNTCTATSTVTDCSEYESETLCSKCNSTFILSKDKTACTAINSSAGANCSVGRNTGSPECIVCNEGYFFNDEGVCTECQVTGCAICDVINLRKCRLCKSGYQMSELFYCEPIGSTLSKMAREININVILTEDDNGVNLWASGFFMMILSLFLFGRTD